MKKSGKDVLILPIIFLIFIVSCITGVIRNQPPPGVEFGEIDDYPPGAVVHFERANFFMVRLPNQQNTPERGLMAVSDRDPTSRCQIESFPYEKYVLDNGTTLIGLLKDSCQGTVYYLDGTALNGPGREHNLRRFAVHVVGTTVYVEVP